ncbi:hypothetical protein [Pedobacter jamesrossensis]|uniref:hypothetical protein n=1 Tax=Pedobacter jamesrossensis TaxID=1908238 RepID=UPI003613D86F
MDASHPFAYGMVNLTIHLKQIEEYTNRLLKAGMLGSLSDKKLKGWCCRQKGERRFKNGLIIGVQDSAEVILCI